jgi:hypothetical protein
MLMERAKSAALLVRKLKRFARYRGWVSGHAAFLLHQRFDRERNLRRGLSDEDHLRSAAQWLAAAQDSQSDGGVAGRYHLARGWTSSYPETTGYLVPTFLALSRALPEAGFRDRAGRAVRFLLSVQLPDGGFPGFEIAENRAVPSSFDTAQILHGLIAWHRESSDDQVRAAAERAVRWLLSVQDPDGAFRQHLFKGVAATYCAYLACWLAEWGNYAEDSQALAAAGRHLDWTLSYRRENDWIALCGFDENQHRASEAFTHTIAYTLSGVLTTSEILGRQDGIALVKAAAERLSRRLELSRFLPGLIGADWRGRSEYACLTGNCQMALIWFRLHQLLPNLRLVNAALKAIDLVKLAQPMRNPNPGLFGGIPGSDPVYGDYIEGAVPNWAAKYFVDALLAKQSVLSDLRKEPARPIAAPTDSRGPVVGLARTSDERRLNIVLLTKPRSRKARQILDGWRKCYLGNIMVIIEHQREDSAWIRVRRRLRNEGLSWIQRRIRGHREATTGASATARQEEPLLSWCRSHGLAVVETGPLDNADTVGVIRDLRPDLGVHAGVGLLRRPLIEVFRLGVLNAHMGLLPAYRGMNVAEWAALEGSPVGCTVHLIDTGIDTGPILATRQVDTAGCRSVAALFEAVDQAQIDLLGAVVGLIASGDMPQPLSATDVGPQFFSMHPELTAILEARLAGRSRGATHL